MFSRVRADPEPAAVCRCACWLAWVLVFCPFSPGCRSVVQSFPFHFAALALTLSRCCSDGIRVSRKPWGVLGRHCWRPRGPGAAAPWAWEREQVRTAGGSCPPADRPGRRDPRPAQCPVTVHFFTFLLILRVACPKCWRLANPCL